MPQKQGDQTQRQKQEDVHAEENTSSNECLNAGQVTLVPV